MKSKDLTGSRVGLLLLLQRKRENNRTYYYCKCECGNKVWIRSDSLNKQNKPTRSCGCLAEETQFKDKDITNFRFGRLVAIKKTKERDSNGCVIWECICDCGSIKLVSEHNLERGGVTSCGCYKKDVSRIYGKEVGELHVKNNIINDTNLQVIKREKPTKANTSGSIGVRWDGGRQKWVAYITFRKKYYFLGRYDIKEDAIKVREEYKEKLHKEFIRSLENESKGNI